MRRIRTVTAFRDISTVVIGALLQFPDIVEVLTTAAQSLHVNEAISGNHWKLAVLSADPASSSPDLFQLPRNDEKIDAQEISGLDIRLQQGAARHRRPGILAIFGARNLHIHRPLILEILPMLVLRPRILTPLLCLLLTGLGFAGVANAGSLALQIDSPWNTTGANTGAVGTTGITGDAALWRTSGFLDDHPSYSDAARYGALAAMAGTTGDFFSLTFANGAVDTLTITLEASLLDPVFLVGDLDIPGTTLTVTPGFSAFTNNADGMWAGSVLTVLSGQISNPVTVGAHAAIQYTGAFAQGATFSFAFDYSGTNFGPDNVLVGLYVVPEPTTALLLLGGLMPLALARRSGCRKVLRRE